MSKERPPEWRTDDGGYLDDVGIIAMTADTPCPPWDAVKRRCEQAGLPSFSCNYSFRVAAITPHQESGGRLEDAQRLARHADARTTRLYVRTARENAQAEIERVQL